MGSIERCMESKATGLGNPPSARDEGGVSRVAQMLTGVIARVETSAGG